ncbi:hypothetical protein HDU82_007908 [Entophlyctis luteolus]|nr:hypothetical protein HDU82_007908 [Entophlyctis luteolus]
MSLELVLHVAGATRSSVWIQTRTFKKLHPREFHRRFLAQGVRPDGREGLLTWRTQHVLPGTLDTCAGSALIRIGGTTALCGVKVEVTVPDTNSPTTGFLVPNVDFPPLCSPAFKAGPPQEFAQSISEIVWKIVQGNNVIDLESLCIEAGKAVWVVYADVVFLNYEGNAVDAALLALVAALKNTKIPKAVYFDVEGCVKTDSSAECEALDVKRAPFGSTFGIFEAANTKDGLGAATKLAMADPTDEEESVLISTLTVVVDGFSGEMMGIYGAQVSSHLFKDCISMAKQRASDCEKLLQ